MENENKVITKDDERKALEQIKKIVESVGGEKSYIGTAFKGVFELAEQNIEYDAAVSAKWYIDEVNNAVAEKRKRQEEFDRAVNACNKAQTERDDANKRFEDFYKRFREQEVRAIKAEETLAAKDVEIIKLKAKLYDLTVKE